MNDVGGHHRVKPPVRLADLQNVFALECDIAKLPALLFRLFQHLFRKIRRDKAFAFRRDAFGQQPRPARTFQHLIRRGNLRFHIRAKRPVRLFVPNVGKQVVDPGGTIPKHAAFLLILQRQHA